VATLRRGVPGDGDPRLGSASLRDAAHDELAASGADLVALGAAARVTGGALLSAPPTAERPLPRLGAVARAPTPLAPWAALVALALILTEAGWGTLRARARARPVTLNA
jgi:hypothetical protein